MTPSSPTPSGATAPRDALDRVEIVRRALGALDGGDEEAALALLHRDAEWHNTRAFPGTRVVHGARAILRFWAAFREDFDQDVLEIEEVHAGGDRVVCGLRSVGAGRASGARLETRWAIAALIRDGRIARIDVRGDVDKAMQTAGLSS